MKNLQILTIIILLATSACNNSPKIDNGTSNKVEKSFEILYECAETTDKNFCNPDSIIPTDCLGNFYFTKNGGVVYTFSCLGGDTTRYDIGKYKISDNGITCTFNRIYSFYNGYNNEDSPKPYDPNLGIIKNCKTWTFELSKLDCKKYEFDFQTDKKGTYVLYKPNQEHSENFYTDFKKVKVLSDL